MRRVRGTLTPSRLVLAAILAAGLALRLAHNDYGLPFVWSLDEGTHFTNRAVIMFRSGLDPGYYQNPTTYTYLIHAVLRLYAGPLGVFSSLPYGNLTEQFAQQPRAIWIAARSVAAVLCMVGVVTAYFAASRLWGRREGLVAAAVLSFAFLPVAYSRVAVTDVGSLAGIALCLYASVRVYEHGRLRHYLLAGAAAGLAVSFKYTAGLTLLPLAIAALARLRADRLRVVGCVVLAGAAAAAVFAALNPYLVINFDEFRADLRGQRDITSNVAKAGQQGSGVGYYLDSLTWGLGWLAALAALGGLAIEAARDRVRALILAALPVALFVYLAAQSRYFGRWLLPAYPALAMLAAVGVVRASELVRGRPALRAAALPVLAGVMLAQPLAADVRSAMVLGRADTRAQAREFLADRYGPELRASIEPAVPGRYQRAAPDGRRPPWLERCPPRRGWEEPGWRYRGEDGREVCQQFMPGQFSPPDVAVRASAYHQVLNPQVIDEYRFYGYCVIVTFNVVRDRAIDSGGPEVDAYYRRLARESKLVRTFSPYDPGAKPVPFSFDLSYNYYPTAFRRPGPLVRVYRLRRCRQAYGASVIEIPNTREMRPATADDS